MGFLLVRSKENDKLGPKAVMFLLLFTVLCLRFTPVFSEAI